MGNGCLITFKKMQKQPLEVFYKKAVLKNFAKFTGKNLFGSLFLILNIAKILKEHPQTGASENVFMKLSKIKNC